LFPHTLDKFFTARSFFFLFKLPAHWFHDSTLLCFSLENRPVAPLVALCYRRPVADLEENFSGAKHNSGGFSLTNSTKFRDFHTNMQRFDTNSKIWVRTPTQPFLGPPRPTTTVLKCWLSFSFFLRERWLSFSCLDGSELLKKWARNGPGRLDHLGHNAHPCPVPFFF
jgi:hypothetical protein